MYATVKRERRFLFAILLFFHRSTSGDSTHEFICIKATVSLMMMMMQIVSHCGCFFLCIIDVCPQVSESNLPRAQEKCPYCFSSLSNVQRFICTKSNKYVGEFYLATKYRLVDWPLLSLRWYFLSVSQHMFL